MALFLRHLNYIAMSATFIDFALFSFLQGLLASTKCSIYEGHLNSLTTDFSAVEFND